jgi:hypothetical protein
MNEDLWETLSTRLLPALNGAAETLLNQAAELPPLRWTLNPGRDGLALVGMATSDYPETEIPAVLGEWAALLDLAPQPPNPYLPGALIFTGTTDGVHIEIWGVTDRHAWETVCTTALDDHERQESRP